VIPAFAFNLESAGGVVERNIVGFLAKQIKRGAELSQSGRRAIEEILDAVRSNLRAAASKFTTGDERAAGVLAEQIAAVI
jgi:phosphate:Na+ symporter